MPHRRTSAWILLLALSAWASPAHSQEPSVPAGIRSVDSAGRLTSKGAPRIARGRKLAVVVHGINPDHADLDPLSRDLARRGYTVVRFVYDDSERLHRSAARLRSALAQIQRESRPGQLRVVAHSMGGLVARRALTKDPLPSPPESPEASQGRVLALAGPLTLVTIASPFGGFWPANLSRADFGKGPPVFRDLGNWAKFIRKPGELASGVTHVKVETKEKGKRLSGKSDKSVRLRRQKQKTVDKGARVVYRVDRGHVGSINQGGRVPEEIRSILTRAFRGRLPPKSKALPAAAKTRRGSSRGIVGRLGGR
ncbi:MAG: hypothetical protein JKY65_12095 [Planctomycetes bacterium]|nr:hypothetical protein [Planctomycetota bacterium]